MKLAIAGAVFMSLLTTGAAQAEDITKYVRYEAAGVVAYGILEGDTIKYLAHAFDRVTSTSNWPRRSSTRTAARSHRSSRDLVLRTRRC